MKTMNYIKGFDRFAFVEYLQERFNFDKNSFTFDMINNIIEYAHKYKHVSKDQFAEFLADMIPEIEFAEVAAFCADGCLTAYGINAKHDFWNEHE